MVFSGDDLQRMLEGTMQARATCRKCHASFSFEEGGSCARKHGITDKVLVCPKCHAAYEVSVTPTAVTLLADVTAQYGDRLPASPEMSKGETATAICFAIVLSLVSFAVLIFWTPSNAWYWVVWVGGVGGILGAVGLFLRSLGFR